MLLMRSVGISYSFYFFYFISTFTIRYNWILLPEAEKKPCVLFLSFTLNFKKILFKKMKPLEKSKRKKKLTLVPHVKSQKMYLHFQRLITKLDKLILKVVKYFPSKENNLGVV